MRTPEMLELEPATEEQVEDVVGFSYDGSMAVIGMMFCAISGASVGFFVGWLIWG